MDINSIREFLTTHHDLILRVFPRFDIRTGTAEDQFDALQNLVWKTTEHEPMMKQLGYERFIALPLDKKLTLIQQTLTIIDLLKKANDF